MKLLPILLSLSEAGKKNNAGKEVTECGCNVDDVASNYIQEGVGTATCTETGKKGLKINNLVFWLKDDRKLIFNYLITTYK